MMNWPGRISRPRGSDGSHGVFDFQGGSRPGELSGNLKLVAQTAVFAVCGFSLLDQNPRT
jgi:hypothetical protein